MNLKFYPAQSVSVPVSFAEAQELDKVFHTATPQELDLATHITKGKLWLALDDKNNPSYYDANDHVYWCVEVPVPRPYSDGDYHRRGWFRSIREATWAGEEQGALVNADADGGCFGSLDNAVIQTQADLLIQDLLMESNTCDMCWGSGVSEFEEIPCPLCGGSGFIKLCNLH